MALTSLAQWSQEHIQCIFESNTDEISIQAIEETFSKTLRGNINGKDIGYEHLKQSVLALRKEAKDSGLKVVWDKVIEVPIDAKNKVRSLPSR